jgi:hypothetical protein
VDRAVGVGRSAPKALEHMEFVEGMEGILAQKQRCERHDFVHSTPSNRLPREQEPDKL